MASSRASSTLARSVDLRGELDQIAPHDLFNSCGAAYLQDERFDLPLSSLVCHRGNDLALLVMSIAH
jgi:hypothetical protein